MESVRESSGREPDPSPTSQNFSTLPQNCFDQHSSQYNSQCCPLSSQSSQSRRKRIKSPAVTLLRQLCSSLLLSGSGSKISHCSSIVCKCKLSQPLFKWNIFLGLFKPSLTPDGLPIIFEVVAAIIVAVSHATAAQI